MSAENLNGNSIIIQSVEYLSGFAASQLANDGTALYSPPIPYTLKDVIEAVEDSMIDKVLENTRGNKSLTASILGVSRGTVINNLRRRGKFNSGT